jgi:hypothetical protein
VLIRVMGFLLDGIGGSGSTGPQDRRPGWRFDFGLAVKMKCGGGEEVKTKLFSRLGAGLTIWISKIFVPERADWLN